MRLIRKMTLIMVPALLVFFQNCSPVHFDKVSSLFSAKVDGGSVFDGKPSFYLTHPEFSCEGKLAPVGVIQYSDLVPNLTFNQNDHCEAITHQTLSSSDIDRYPFDPNFLGYRDGIYERHDSPPDMNSPVLNEAWCESTNGDDGITLALKFDEQNKSTTSQIFYSSGGKIGAIPEFAVTRVMTDVSAEYSSEGFHLLIDRSQPAPQKWWYFKGQLETNKATGSWKNQVLCRMASSRLLTMVQKIYPKNSDWTSYVQRSDQSKDVWSQPDLACSNATSWNQCLHGGDKLLIESEFKDCTNLVASDQLGYFDWKCESLPSGVVFRTNRLKKGRGLSDLLTKDGWKQNFVQIKQLDHVRYESIPISWWKNPVIPFVPDPLGAPVQLRSPNSIYVVDSNISTPGIQVMADHVSLVVQSGATLKGNANLNPNCNLTGGHFGAPDATLYPIRCLLTSEGHDFLWVEGAFDSSGSNAMANINLFRGQGMRLQNVKMLNSTLGFGLFQDSIAASIFDSIEAKGNRHGLVSNMSVGNLFGYSNFSNNLRYGFWLTAWDNQSTIVNSRAVQNGFTGFSFNSTQNPIMISSQTQGNTISGIEVTGFTEQATFESTVSSGDQFGLDVSRASTHPLQPNIYKNTALMATALGLRVFDGGVNNTEVFDGLVFFGSSTHCSITAPSGTNQICPDTGLTSFSQCQLSGDSILCPGAKSFKNACQIPDSSSNPLINWSSSVDIPACSTTDIFK